ncbi:MAG: ROK family protein [Spirochaetaceae bacterium]|jgi:glucokinase|nr:ROK family protein [Spirochaetaceae bacterium]
MKKEYLIGVDIGGTKIAIVLGTMDGDILKKVQFPTERSYKEVLNRISRHINELAADLKGSVINAIGISCGGPLNSQNGVILSPPNLPGWDEVPVCDILTQATGIPSFLENDGNACALAEWLWGAGKGTRNMIFLTFGTGLGAGLILDGKLYEGTSGMAGEVGHIRLSEDGPEGYGKAGSWEGFCSGGGLSRFYHKRYGIVKSGEEICTLANNGDEKALSVIDLSASYLGQGISILLDILNPQKVIIGSIYTRNEALFRETMNNVINREALIFSAKDCHIVPAALGENLGDMAALSVAMNGIRNQKDQK